MGGTRGIAWVRTAVFVAIAGMLASGCLGTGSASPARRSVVVAAEPSPGCAAATAVVPGETTLPMTAGGDTGTYISEVPGSYDPRRPMPVVFDFHGYSEPASGQAVLSGLGDYGQTHGFITITPQVTELPQGPEKVPLWQATIGSSDLAFFAGLLDHVERTLCIDEHRVFVTGYSNGALMSSVIACQFAGRVAAAAPVAGIEFPSGCDPSRPVPMIAFHGTADPYVHFDGTPSPVAAALPSPDGSGGTLGQYEASQPGAQPGVLTPGPTIPEQAAAWARRYGCRTAPADRTVATGVTLMDYPCPANAAVELYVVKGGGHAWPGSPTSEAIRSAIGFTTMAISATALMWQFFAAHPLTRAG